MINLEECPNLDSLLTRVNATESQIKIIQKCLEIFDTKTMVHPSSPRLPKIASVDWFTQAKLDYQLCRQLELDRVLRKANPSNSAMKMITAYGHIACLAHFSSGKACLSFVIHLDKDKLGIDLNISDSSIPDPKEVRLYADGLAEYIGYISGNLYTTAPKLRTEQKPLGFFQKEANKLLEPIGLGEAFPVD